MKMIFKTIFLFVFVSTVLQAHSMIKNSTDIKKSGKPIMVLFSTKTCPYCEVFKKDIKEHKELNSLAKDFEIYEIKRDEQHDYTMWGKKTNLKTLEMTFAIKATPNTIIFDKTGRKIWQVPGYADPTIMVPYLKFVKGLDSGKYDITKWKEYLRQEGIIK
ncbi:MAG: hypothetical protein DRG11_05900 [Epsilonproteobacteria bacterium]|nr:MAG: hypothetical protein DRG11_05900 [Campylobacterota bacterium]